MSSGEDESKAKGQVCAAGDGRLGLLLRFHLLQLLLCSLGEGVDFGCRPGGGRCGQGMGWDVAWRPNLVPKALPGPRFRTSAEALSGASI